MPGVKLKLTGFFFAALFLVTGCVGCSSNTPAFDGIVNRGVTPVSSQSPFIGSNMFLAQEMEGSQYLYNFIRTHGAPQAIALEGRSELKSELLMFYSKDREYYSALPHIESETKRREWIIRGPFPVMREHYPHIVHLDSGLGGVFEIFGRREVFGGPARANETRIIQPAFIPTPVPTTPVKKRKIATHREQASSDKAPPGPVIAVQGTPINFDQEALFEAKKREIPLLPSANKAPQDKSTEAASAPTLNDAFKSALKETPKK